MHIVNNFLILKYRVKFSNFCFFVNLKVFENTLLVLKHEIKFRFLFLKVRKFNSEQFSHAKIWTELTFSSFTKGTRVLVNSCVVLKHRLKSLVFFSPYRYSELQR